MEKVANHQKVFDELSNKHPTLSFLKIEAEEFPEVSEKFEIAMVPTFIVLVNQNAAQRIEGANAPLLATSLNKFSKQDHYVASTATSAPAQQQIPLKDRLTKLVNSQPVMIFIKGTPEQPRCGFSKSLLEILEEKKIQFGSFNILADEEVRAGLKEFSEWPTYPQVYVNGNFVGGLDIIKELVATGEFDSTFPKPESLEQKLTRLINQTDCVLFMKGNPDTPRCGFSRQIVKLLQDQGVKFSTYDILEDEEVRAGLKEFSNWPTYPQLFGNFEKLAGKTAGDFGAKLVSRIQVAKGEEVASIANIQRNATKRWSTVQMSENEHIELDPNSGLVYMNHSCDPSVFVDCDNKKVVALKDIQPGAELTFFYPSTGLFSSFSN
ncbi:Glutaredoxin 3 [Phlyctochytrium planicorne]|nr:Glutaredoxin 3 [Phlyctochytrium planicorne]